MVIGKPDLTELNEVISDLEEKLNREINYMCFDQEEFKERRKAGDAFIKEVLSAKKIMLLGSEHAI